LVVDLGDRNERRAAAGAGGLWIGVSAFLHLKNNGILQSPFIDIVRGSICLPQLVHLLWGVRDLLDAVAASSTGAQNNRFRGIIDNDDFRVIPLGDEFEDTVLEVFIVDRPVIKESDVGARGF
jgi:hypothetical protein